MDVFILLLGLPFFLEWYKNGFIAACKVDDWIIFAPIFLIFFPLFFWAKDRKERVARQKLDDIATAIISDASKLDGKGD